MSFNNTWSTVSQDVLVFGRTIAMSSNGQYQTAIGESNEDPSSYKKLYRSTNYGNSWSETNSIISIWNGISISSNGSYQVAACYDIINDSINSSLYYSNDYGLNWTKNTNFTRTILRYPRNNIAISADGYFQAVSTTEGLCVSRDKGLTWIIADTFNDPENNQGKNDIAISNSNSGEYILTNYIYNNIHKLRRYSGNTWSDISLPINEIVDISVNDIDRYSLAISGTGQYQTIGVLFNVFIDDNYISFSTVFYSHNYGLTWRKSTIDNIRGYENNICMSNDGQYQTFINDFNNPYSSIYFSTDYGVTWVKNADIQDRLRDCAMSYDGKYQTLVTVSLYKTVLDLPSPVDIAIAAFAQAQHIINLNESGAEIAYRNNNQNTIIIV